jgi:hypothetical protein
MPFGFDTELDGADSAHRVDHLDDGAALALTGRFELVGKIVLVQGIGFDFVNTTVKIMNLRPAFGFGDDGIAEGGSGILPLPSAAVLQIVGENLEIIFALDVPLFGCQAIPGQSHRIVGLDALSELIHSAELVFRVAVTLRRRLVKPGHRPHIVGFHAGAMLKHIADVLLSVVVAMCRGFVIPGKSLGIILRLAHPSPAI